MMCEYPETCAIILAGGIGSRMGLTDTKQTLSLCGVSVLKRAVTAFDRSSVISSIVVVCRKEERDFVNKECQNLTKPYTVVNGGKSRAESAALGFSAIMRNTAFVMIHDAARPLITVEEITSVARAAYVHGAATASLRVSDTLKRCDDDGRIIDTVPRESLRAVQTPQCFAKEIYEKAIKCVSSLDSSITDDNMLVEKSGVLPYCVETLSTNIKITAREDLELAEFIIKKREGSDI